MNQTYKDFEWLIVDDGSTDSTAEVVEGFQNKSFPIRYVKKENGGKHTAINFGVCEAKGELFFIADSDDMLPPNALRTVMDEWLPIKADPVFGGICGLDATFGGEVIGSGLPTETIDDTSIAVRSRMGVIGDMKEVFRTSVLREFPFPEILGERFCPEVLVWNRIATKYKLHYFDQIIYLVEYQKDGVTSGITKARMDSPMASTMTYAEMLRYDIPFMQKVKAAVNYWRFYYCKHGTGSPPVPLGWKVMAPLGWWMHVNDLRH